MQIKIEHNIAEDLYDILAHCRTDTLENFVGDLMGHLDELAAEYNDQ